MDTATLQGRLEFLRQAEKLKDVLRSARSSGGRQESTAEHTWRLCLMAMMLEEGLADLDFARVLRLCVVHDLGEAIHRDIPATRQSAAGPGKGVQERQDLLQLAGPLDEAARARLLALWDDYENAASAEARAVKAMDKLETLLQHNQGANAPDFDYAFNLDYGRKHTDALPLFREIRRLLDADTEAHIRRQAAARAAPSNAPADVVQRQLDAYNARDIDAFMAAWADDCLYYAFPDTLLASGSAQIRQRHVERFQEPDLHGRLVSRIVNDDMVVDQEVVTRNFADGPGEIDVVAIYEVRDGRIAKAWFNLGQPRPRAGPA
ncbi:hypothetical protein LMG7053_02361 [Achromobacter ruhlandii]|uniref:5'-deoxynucleotidase n=2 Tax=Achromobacter ruhlandii TaxID=72557 RepID=A0ABM8LTQ7_9BURK|nr:hypothetical protein LMG7053_02361 [Achromobacter ruhlandii]